MDRPGGGELRIVAARKGAHLVLQVCDDGLGLRPGAAHGVGLSNTTERLRGLYGQQHQFGLAARTGGGVTTTVKLPYRDVTAGGDDR